MHDGYFLEFIAVNNACELHVSGVEKLTRSSLKGLSDRRPLFAYKNGCFASRFLLLGIGCLEASKKANSSFKSTSPKPHLNRTGPVFALPNVEIIGNYFLYSSYMRIVPQHVSGHIRDTCMKFLGINKCKCYMLVTCRKCCRIKHVSFSSTMVDSLGLEFQSQLEILRKILMHLWPLWAMDVR